MAAATRNERTRNERARALRLLAKGTGRVRAAADGRKALLDGGDAGTISIGLPALRRLLREGLVLAEGETLTLTPEGAAHLRRVAAASDAFRAQHADLHQISVEAGNGWKTATVNLRESPLAQLARRRTPNGRPFLLHEEFRAGERLRADYTRGRIMPRLGANWQSAVAGRGRDGSAGGMVELTDAALAARQRVDRALEAVGPELAGVLVDICCFLKGLETVETERGWPVRSAKVVLKTALTSLARHYRPERGGDAGREHRILHWGAAGYRPSLRSGES